MACHTFGLEVAHLVDLDRTGEHEIGGQGVVFGIADRVFSHYLHDILLLVQDIIYIERKGDIVPTLVDRGIEDDLVDIAEVVAIARGVAAVGADGP